MKNEKKELEIIDPFAEEYRNMATIRSDAHYRELYEELFRSIPTRARTALVKNYLQYINNCLRPFFSFLHPFSWINPQAILTNISEAVANSVKGYLGLSKFLHDQMVSSKLIEKSSKYFTVGENVATTPCQVVYRSPLLTLRRYIPRENTVYRVPLLMIYSIINGYYILDLTEELSMIKYFVDRGYDVFVTDWNIITDETKNATLEDYIAEIVEAKQTVKELTRETQIGGLGYCIGGTYLDIDAALSGGYRYVVNLATLLNSKVGESGAGVMGVYSDFSINDIDNFIEKHNGVFPGEILQSFFDWVKPEKAANIFMDLYFYGKEYEYGNDAIFFWNTQSARDVAGPAHRQYLWEIYHENNLANNKMTLFGTTINLKNIGVPFCNVAALFDHIVEFPTALATAYLIGTPPEDQVTIKINGGHVRGVVNPVLYPLLEGVIQRYSGLKNRPV